MRTAHAALRGVDLNLVRVLDALLAERHVTRAAARLGISQSAASHALARLRRLLADPLLVRGPRGARGPRSPHEVMVPTPRALALAPALERALAELAAALRPPAPFDPATARRTFHLAIGDYAELVLLPALVARLATIAPGVDLFVRAVPDDLAAALAAGDVDLVLAPPRPRDLSGPGLYQRHLFDERFVCALRRGHPAATRRLTLDRFCDLDHVLIAPRGTAGGYVDDALARLGRRRRVAVTVPHFLVVPHVVATTDLVVTLPARVAAALAAPHRLVTRPPPAALGVTGFAIHQLWHERTHGDAAGRWLRDQLATVARALPPP